MTAPLPRHFAAALLCSVPLFAQTAPIASTPTPKDEALQLSVFTVTADPGDSYEALNATSLTGTRKDLRRTPVSADILNRTLLDDLGVTDLAKAMEFVTGLGSARGGGTTDPSGDLDGDRVNQTQFVLRGMITGAPRRNGLIDGQGSGFDNFSHQRVEVIRGPQALLYGPARNAGVINLVTKHAAFSQRRGAAALRLDEFGSWRATADYNLGLERVAALVSTVRGAGKFWRDNLANDRGGYYANVAVRPLANRPTTTVRLEFEDVWRDTVDPITIRLNAPATDPTYGSRNQLPLRLLLAQDRARDVFGGRVNFDNVDSFGGDYNGQFGRHKWYSATAETDFGRLLSLQLVAARTYFFTGSYAYQNNTGLTPPGLGGNPTGDWAARMRPAYSNFSTDARIFRATANSRFALFRGWLKNDLSAGFEHRYQKSFGQTERYYEIDGGGAFISNAALINNADAGRTLIPDTVWVPFGGGWAGRFQQNTNILELDGRRYARAEQKIRVASLRTAENPLGYNAGPAGVTALRNPIDAFFAAYSGSMFNERLDLLAGYRHDKSKTTNLAVGPLGQTPGASVDTTIVGATFAVTKNISAYANRSEAFRPPGGLTTENKLPPVPKGIGEEVGVKSDWLGGRISASLTAYRVTETNESGNLANDVRSIVDPLSSVSGLRNGGATFVFDRRSRGIEFNVTARPLAGLRLIGGFTAQRARTPNDSYLPIFYNDEFHVNAAGQIVFENGTPLRVPVNPNTPGFNPLNPGATPTQILTVAMLRSGDAAGNYRANLEPSSGAILNGSALFLNTAGIATGRTGLPVAQHQLGFTPPSGSTFLAQRGGDKSTGYAEHAFSLTAHYTIQQGRLKGLGVGTNLRVRLDQLGYYYTDRVTNPAAPVRRLLVYPNQTLVGLWAGYEFRVARGVFLRTQLNLDNLFAAQHTRVFPNVGTGAPDNARLDAGPRSVAWTNSMRF